MARSGAFDCLIKLDLVEVGKHEIEIRTQVGHRTERARSLFMLLEEAKQSENGEDKPSVAAEASSSEEGEPASTEQTSIQDGNNPPATLDS